MRQTVTKRPFLPYLFPRKGKDRAAAFRPKSAYAQPAFGLRVRKTGEKTMKNWRSGNGDCHALVRRLIRRSFHDIGRRIAE